MEKIKEFLEKIFAEEQHAIFLEYKKDKIEDYNVFIEEKININFQDTYDETLNEIIPFNLIGKLYSPASDRFYKSKENASYPNPRHIYKVSHYINDNYHNLWACYVSIANPYMNTKRINDCFVVTEILGELKVIAKFGPDIDKPEWKFYGGDRGLKINKLGKLQSIERYLEPNDDTWSIEEYNKNI